MLLLTPLAWGFGLIYGKKRVAFRAGQPEISNPASLITIFVPVLRALAPSLYTCTLVIIVAHSSIYELWYWPLVPDLRPETSLAMASIKFHITHTFLESMMASLDVNNAYLTGVTPVALSNINSSSLGFFCPNNMDQIPPRYCPPTPECEITRLETLWNTFQQIQDPYMSMICKPGYYCLAGGREQIICPPGNYRPLGSFKPIQYDVPSSCHQGSSRQSPFLGISMIIIDISLALLFD
ncbi:uncharacterized protein EAE98_002383 [Botrytis deweyae]|uniref:Carbohydrate-binding module family 19 domain-containing protein n=1 Tax=Botrytis deweyae TaxID=2478750 RepID=A0ABQ7IX53_9HELO|nr:uncharacterized protein EAE98_002383 [Botrytis deweyae]KAF7936164.1 hypothetical protein EAE98_002383 [Botrytis deweyae]